MTYLSTLNPSATAAWLLASYFPRTQISLGCQIDFFDSINLFERFPRHPHVVADCREKTKQACLSSVRGSTILPSWRRLCNQARMLRSRRSKLIETKVIIMYAFASSHHAPIIYQKLHPGYAPTASSKRTESKLASYNLNLAIRGRCSLLCLQCVCLRWYVNESSLLLEQSPNPKTPSAPRAQPAEISDRINSEEHGMFNSKISRADKVASKQQDLIYRCHPHLNARPATHLPCKRSVSEERLDSSRSPFKDTYSNATLLKRSCSASGLERKTKRHQSVLVAGVT
jgi:hypothetical protein